MGDWLFKRSGRLFARPSFVEGAARVFDMGATLNVYNEDSIGPSADAKALLSDWQAVGDVISDAASVFEQEQTDSSLPIASHT